MGILTKAVHANETAFADEYAKQILSFDFGVQVHLETCQTPAELAMLSEIFGCKYVTTGCYPHRNHIVAAESLRLSNKAIDGQIEKHPKDSILIGPDFEKVDAYTHCCSKIDNARDDARLQKAYKYTGKAKLLELLKGQSIDQCCVDGFENCLVKARYAYASHVYDLSLDDLLLGMKRHDTHIVKMYMFLPDELAFEVDCSDEKYGYELLFACNNPGMEKGTVAMSFGDGSFNYLHSLDIWKGYLINKSYSAHGLNVMIETESNIGPVSVVSITRTFHPGHALVYPKPLKDVVIIHDVISASQNIMHLLKFSSYSKCLQAYDRVRRFAIPKQVYENMLFFGMMRQDDKVERHPLFAIFKSLITKVRIGDHVVQRGWDVRPEDVNLIFMNVYIKILILRRQQTKTCGDIIRYLDRPQDPCFLQRMFIRFIDLLRPESVNKVPPGRFKRGLMHVGFLKRFEDEYYYLDRSQKFFCEMMKQFEARLGPYVQKLEGSEYPDHFSLDDNVSDYGDGQLVLESDEGRCFGSTLSYLRYGRDIPGAFPDIGESADLEKYDFVKGRYVLEGNHIKPVVKVKDYCEHKIFKEFKTPLLNTNTGGPFKPFVNLRPEDNFVYASRSDINYFCSQCTPQEHIPVFVFGLDSDSYSIIDYLAHRKCVVLLPQEAAEYLEVWMSHAEYDGTSYYLKKAATGFFMLALNCASGVFSEGVYDETKSDTSSVYDLSILFGAGEVVDMSSVDVGINEALDFNYEFLQPSQLLQDDENDSEDSEQETDDCGSDPETIEGESSITVVASNAQKDAKRKVIPSIDKKHFNVVKVPRSDAYKMFGGALSPVSNDDGDLFFTVRENVYYIYYPVKVLRMSETSISITLADPSYKRLFDLASACNASHVEVIYDAACTPLFRYNLAKAALVTGVSIIHTNCAVCLYQHYYYGVVKSVNGNTVDGFPFVVMYDKQDYARMSLDLEDAMRSIEAYRKGMKIDTSSEYVELKSKVDSFIERFMEKKIDDGVLISGVDGCPGSGKSHMVINDGAFRNCVVICPFKKLVAQYKKAGFRRVYTFESGLKYAEGQDIVLDEVRNYPPGLLYLYLLNAKSVFFVGDSHQIPYHDKLGLYEGLKTVNHILKHAPTTVLTVSRSMPLDVVALMVKFSYDYLTTTSTVINSIYITTNNKTSGVDEMCFTLRLADARMIPTVTASQGLHVDEMMLHFENAANELIQLVPGQFVTAFTRHRVRLDVCTDGGYERLSRFGYLRMPTSSSLLCGEKTLKVHEMGLETRVRVADVEFVRENFESKENRNLGLSNIKPIVVREDEKAKLYLPVQQYANESIFNITRVDTEYPVIDQDKNYFPQHEVAREVPRDWLTVDIPHVDVSHADAILSQISRSGLPLGHINVGCLQTRFGEVNSGFVLDQLRKNEDDAVVGNRIITFRKPMTGNYGLVHKSGCLNMAINAISKRYAGKTAYYDAKDTVFLDNMYAKFKTMFIDRIHKVDNDLISNAVADQVLKIKAKPNDIIVGFYDYVKSKRISFNIKQQTRSGVTDNAWLGLKDSKVKAAQGIAEVDKAVILLSGSVIRALSSRFESSLKSSVCLAAEMSPLEMSRWLYQRTGEGVKFEADISQFDQMRGNWSDHIFDRLMEDFGVDKELRLLIGSVSNYWKLRHPNIRMPVFEKFQSGRADTLFSNTFINMVLVANCVEVEKPLFMMFKGDDSVMCAKRINIIKEEGFFKVQTNDAPSFVGYLITDKGIVLDLPTRVAKVLNRCYKSQKDLDEYIIAVGDWLSVIMNDEQKQLMYHYNAFRYGITYFDCAVLFSFLQLYAKGEVYKYIKEVPIHSSVRLQIEDDRIY